jgi:sec-independent protein translocase protein TatA
MGGLGFSEILILVFVVLLLFGAGRIADVGKGLGDAVKNLKKSLKEGDEDTKQLPAKPEGTGKDSKTV